MADRTVRVTLAAQVNTYISDVQRAAAATQKTGDAAQDAAAKFEQQNRAMSQIGAGLAAAGAVALAATGLAVKAAIDWESAWAGVTKTVDGSEAEMAALEEQLRSLTSVLPATHEEIAGVAEAAGQLGVAREDIAAFTKTMIDLSETTNLTADEAATSIAQLMNVMQTAPDDVDNLGAALVALGNDGASTERDIVQMAQRIAGAGKIVGLSEAEILGFANALASVGIEAEAGGSAISRIMTDIAKSVSAGGEELDRFAKVAGLSSSEFARSFREDPADAIATFVEGLGRINAEGGDVFTTLSELGQSDIRVSQALLGMANSGDLLRNSLQLGSAAFRENTALAEEAAKRYETTEAKIQIAGNAIRDAAIDYGSVFLPAVGAVSEAVTNMAKAFSDLPAPIQAAIAALGTLAGVGALAAGGFLLAVPKIAEFSAALTVLKGSSLPGVAKSAELASSAITRTGGALSATSRFLMGPWGIALGAAAAAAFVFIDAQNRLNQGASEFRDTLDSTTGAITEQTRALAAKKLQDSGAFDAVKQLGVSQRELVDIVTEGGDAYDVLLKKMYDANNNEPFNFELGNSINAIREMRGQFDLAEEGRKNLSAAEGEGESTTRSAADAYRTAASEAGAIKDEILSLINAMNELNGVNQTAEETNARYQASLAGIADDVTRQKEAYEEANGTLEGFNLSMDANTVAGSANRASLAGVAGAAQDAAQAQLDAEIAAGLGEQAARNYSGTLAAQKQAFIDTAIQAGYNEEAVRQYAEEVFALPDQKTLDLIAQTAAAARTIEGFMSRYGELQGVINYRAVTSAATGVERPGRAAGGIIPGAPSEKDNRIYALATGEFVVRSRQVSIPANRAALEYINAGGTIRGYAAGGYVQPQYAAPSVSVVSNARSNPGPIDLSSGTIRKIIEGISGPNVMIDSDAIGHATNAHNANKSFRGGS